MIEAGRAELETGRKQRERPNPDCQLIADSLNAFDNIKVANIFNDAIRMRDMRDMRDIVGNNYGRDQGPVGIIINNNPGHDIVAVPTAPQVSRLVHRIVTSSCSLFHVAAIVCLHAYPATLASQRADLTYLPLLRLRTPLLQCTAGFE